MRGPRKIDIASDPKPLPVEKRDGPSQGFDRRWLKCRECGRVYVHDYQPRSLANPIIWTLCGHSVGHRDLNCDVISEDEARTALEVAIGAYPKKIRQVRHRTSIELSPSGFGIVSRCPCGWISLSYMSRDEAEYHGRKHEVALAGISSP